MPLHDQSYPTFEWEYDLDGKVWVIAKAHGTLVANTPYKIILNEEGYVTAALADGTVYCLIGAPEAAASSGDFCKLQIGGRITALITPSLSMAVGHGLEVHDGAVADVDADYSGLDAEFAAAITASTTSTTQDVMMIPRYILTST